jgi:hypothetical protein
LHCANTNGEPYGMPGPRGPGCNGPFFLVLSLGVVGRDTVSTAGGALTPVVYDASTRTVAIDLVWAEGGASSRYRFLSMPNLGAADGTLV